MADLMKANVFGSFMTRFMQAIKQHSPETEMYFTV